MRAICFEIMDSSLYDCLFFTQMSPQVHSRTAASTLREHLFAHINPRRAMMVTVVQRRLEGLDGYYCLPERWNAGSGRVHNPIVWQPDPFSFLPLIDHASAAKILWSRS